MAKPKVARRLTTIVSIDVAGYSRLMEADEAGTLEQFKAHRKVIDPKIAEHGGRIVGTAGDGLLVEFPSVADAVTCAVDVQSTMAVRNADVAENRRMEFRIGVNLGDVMIEGDDIFGNGVNVAARLQALAEPGGVCISQPVYDQVRHSLDLGYEDLGPQEVKNITEPVRAYRVLTGSESPGEASRATEMPALQLPDKPSIAVLPFDNMSGDPEQEYFSDGITEDIITALSRIRWFLVIARNTTFTYKGQATDIQTVANDLGVRYVLEGSVRKAGNRVRITAQLIDASTGSHIWVDRFDRELEDIFAVQDEITGRVVTAIEPELSRAEQERARRNRPEDLTAWDYYLRGMSLVWRPNKADNDEAQRLFRQATEVDSNFAAGFAGLAAAQLRSIILGHADSPAEAIKDGLVAANTALALDERDSLAYAALSLARIFMRDYESGIEASEKAIDINPNFAFAHLLRGMAFVMGGHAEESLPNFDMMERLSPRDPMIWLGLVGRALANMQLGEFEAAQSWTRMAVQHPNADFLTYVHHIAALGHLGRTEEAKAAIGELMIKKPNFSLELYERTAPYIPDLKKIVVAGLRLAGIEE